MAQLAAAALKDTDAAPRRFLPLTLGAIGIVYGDIGTSPIYAFREAVVAAAGDAAVAPDTVLGILSLILWSLFLLVTLKYVFVLLRADFNGEGGTFALMALAQSVAQRSKHDILLLGIAGTAFLYRHAASALRHIGGRRTQGDHAGFRESGRSALAGHSHRALCHATAWHGPRGVLVWPDHPNLVRYPRHYGCCLHP